mmetsp:Transcript_27098/g.52830  ORF Transcript_27098/g.52830 Transcript_27098/m.52830 type:complete len:189 (-) Transcript_27098:126-692(-)
MPLKGCLRAFGLILCAIFAPPVAVYLMHGCGCALCFNIFLLLCGFFPAMIHAVIVIGMKKTHKHPKDEASKMVEPKDDGHEQPVSPSSVGGEQFEMEESKCEREDGDASEVSPSEVTELEEPIAEKMMRKGRTASVLEDGKIEDIEKGEDPSVVDEGTIHVEDIEKGKHAGMVDERKVEDVEKGTVST